MQLNRSTDYAIQMLVYLAKTRKTVSSDSCCQLRGGYGLSGKNEKDRILLEAGSSYRRISSLSAPDQREAKGGRVYPGRPWSVWRIKIG